MNHRIYRDIGALTKNKVNFYSDSVWYENINWFAAFGRYVNFNDGSLRVLSSSTLEAETLLPIRVIKQKNCFKHYNLHSLSNYYSPYFRVLSSSEQDVESVYDELFSSNQRFLKKMSCIEFKPMIEEEMHAVRSSLERIGFKVSTFQSSRNWYEDKIDDFDGYWKERPGKLKNTVRRKRDKLLKSNDYAVVLHHGDNILESLADFHSVYYSSWKTNEPYLAFIDNVVKEFSLKNQIRMGFVYRLGKPVAAQIWFVYDNIAYIFKLAHRPEYEKQSVGSILTYEMFKYVIQCDGVTKVDFLTGDDDYKKDWMRSSRPLYTLRAFNVKTFFGCVGAIRSYLDRDQN